MARKIFIALFIANCVLFSAEAASKGGSSTIDIPVRFSIAGGYNPSIVNFESDKKDISANQFAFGADFNVPIPPLHFLGGITGWLVPSATAGDTVKTTQLLLGAYLGYLGKQDDFFIGPAIGTMSSTVSGNDASPDSQVTLSTSSGCGFGGWRHYFKKGLTAGVGVNGYYCLANSYDKSVTSSTLVETKSNIEAKASSAGGFIYLLLGWDDTRSL